MSVVCGLSSPPSTPGRALVTDGLEWWEFIAQSQVNPGESSVTYTDHVYLESRKFHWARGVEVLTTVLIRVHQAIF